jgi:hypothetical protein
MCYSSYSIWRLMAFIGFAVVGNDELHPVSIWFFLLPRWRQSDTNLLFTSHLIHTFSTS